MENASRKKAKIDPRAAVRVVLDKHASQNDANRDDVPSTDANRLNRVRVKRLANAANAQQEIDSHAYFLIDRTIRLRHGGLTDALPTVLYLEKQEGVALSRVATFYSESGSGKSAELIGMSFTHCLDLAIVFSMPSDSESLSDIPKRNEKGHQLLTQRVKTVVTPFQKLVDELIAALPDAAVLKLGIAIDEGSSCPNVVRSVISDQDALSLALHKIFPKHEGKINFNFAVAGTGVSGISVGSNLSNMNPMAPSATKETIIEHMINARLDEIQMQFVPHGETETETLTLKYLKSEYKVLFEFLKNARMASIFFKHLAILKKDDSQLDYIGLTKNVIDGYIATNGLSKLNCVEMKTEFAACAFAVLLFQFGMPVDLSQEEFNDYNQTFKCGVTFGGGLLACDTSLTMRHLVNKFGLLVLTGEPSVGTNTKIIYSMSPAMQLVALHLLGVPVEQLIERSAFGFEVLSTQTIKAALAAASVIHASTRPSIKDVLTTVGFQLLDPKSTSSEVTELWKKLDSLKIVPHVFNLDEFPGKEPKKKLYNTLFMEVELEVDTFLFGDEGDSKKAVQIDKNVLKMLNNCTPKTNTDSGSFYPPITALNYGNSPFADGLVSFYVQDTEPGMPTNQDPFMMSIFNQAKDKLGVKKTLAVATLETHAERCSSTMLDKIFGELRLLCVSAPNKASVISKKICKERNWLPRSMASSLILKELMSALNKDRSLEGRIEEHAVFVDEAGNTIEWQ